MKSSTAITKSSSGTIAPPIVDKINAEYRACEGAKASAIDHAMNCGDLLLEAKTHCEYGDWGDWLSRYFEGDPTTATRYMRLAEKRPKIEADRERAPDLSIRAALRLIAGPSRPSKSQPSTNGVAQPEVTEPGVHEADFCPPDDPGIVIDFAGMEGADVSFESAELEAQPAAPKPKCKPGQPIVGRRDRDAARKALSALVRYLHQMDLYDQFVTTLSEIAEAIDRV